MIRSIAPTFFVFPLPNMVLFPMTTKPLNIFEPRYIKMINDAIDEDTMIAMSLIKTGRLRWPMYETIVGVGKPMVLERRDDDSMLVIMECVGRVRLGSIVRSNEPYLVHQGEWMPEDSQVREENLFMLNRLYKDFNQWLQLNVDDHDRLMLFLSQLVSMEMKINYMCALMIQSAEAQQELLEIDDINDRLGVLAVALETQTAQMPIYDRAEMRV